MTITEEDIFKYVLFPDDLTPELKDYIGENEKLFSNRIEFYKSYINSLNDEEIISESKKAVSKIPALQDIVVLYPAINKKIPLNNFTTLAAASAEVVYKQSESVTYTDENSKYLIRLISSKEKGILYFFPKAENKNQKLKITFLPANEIFHIENVSSQIEIAQPKEVEKIIIEEE